MFEGAVGRLSDSATSADGIHAYSANVSVCVSVFTNYTSHLSSSVRPHRLGSFNTKIGRFALKGVQDEDKCAVYREPAQLRILFPN